MAEKKALFRIEINGITESVSAVKDLNEQLKELKTHIKDLEKAKVKVKVDMEQKTTSAGTSSDDGQVQQQAQKNNALAKLAEQLAKAQAKAQAQVTDEYKAQYQELQKVNEQNKEADKVQKQIAQGVRDTNGEYANTLSGLRAYLSELQKTFNQQEIGTDEWKTTQAELTRVRELVKGIEQSTGDFRRNVGNYPSGAKELVALFQQTQQTISDAKAELSALNQQLGQTQQGSQQYQDISARIDELTQSMSAATTQAEELNAQLGEKVKITVGDEVKYYDSLKEAAKDLQKTLQQLVYDGKANTDEFENTVRALGELRTAMSNANGELSSYIGNAKGLKDTVEIMQGLTSLASISTGLQGLFGGQNEELDKSLKKFTQLTMLMNGLSEIQKQINDKTSIWGQTLNSVWSKLQDMSGKLTGFEQAQQFEQNVAVTVDYDNVTKQVEKMTEQLQPLFDSLADEVSESMQQVVSASADALSQAAKGGEDNVREALEKMVTATDEAAEQMQQKMQQISLDPNADPAVVQELSQAISSMDGQFQSAKQTLSDFNDGILDQSEAIGKLREQFTELVKSMGDEQGAADNLADGLGDLIQQQGELAAQSQSASGNMGRMGKLFSSMGSAGKAAATGIRAAAGAVRAFMSATIVLALVQALVMAFEALVDGLKKLSGADAAKAVEDFDGLSASIQNSKDQLAAFNKEVDRAKAAGEINELEANARKLDEVSKAAEKAGNDLKEFISTLDDVKPIDFNKDWEDAWFATRYIKDMDEFEKRYKQLVQAVSQGVDESKVVTGSGSMFLTASDAATNLAEMQKAALGDLESKINSIDFSKGEEAFRQFIELTNKELYASALSNIDKLFDDDKWQQGLKKRIDQYRDFAQQMYDLNTSIAASTKQMEDQIASNLAAAITDPYERANAQRKLQMEKELSDAEGNARLQESIRKKYATQELDARKAHNKQVNADAKAARQRKLQIESDAMMSEINLMSEGLTKQRALLQLQAKQALEAARQNGASKQTLANIQKYWNNQIIDAEKEFNRQVFLAQRERQRTMEDEYRQFSQQMREWESTYQQAVDSFNKVGIDYGFFNGVTKQLEMLGHNTRLTYQDMVDEIWNYDQNVSDWFGVLIRHTNHYYDQASNIQEKALDKKFKIDKAAIDREEEEQMAHLDDMLREREQYYSDWLTQQNDALDAQLKQGLISQQEYDDQMAENQRVTDEHVIAEREKYLQMQEAIEKEWQTKWMTLAHENIESRKSVWQEAYNSRRESLETFYDDLSEIMKRRSEKNRQFMGIIDYKKEKANLKDMQSSFQEILKQIEEEYNHLQMELENGVITFDDFRKAKSELDSLKRKTQDTLKDVQKDLNNLVIDTVKSVTDMAQQYVQAFSDIWGMISNLKDIELDQQEKRLEREQELLDEEMDMLEKQYSKQQELTRKHTDKINDIEGELTNARGDRRDFLLDQLARERDAELKSLETENQIQQEKEKNEKKQQALERQKEQLDKKRWEQNKKNQVVQATINTFTAVTNALAVQPWFVGLALSAVALALGMANVAKIQAQKYYADGGILSGRSHSQGGIPVGNTGIEVEGGEYVINKKTTRYNQSLLEYVNSKRRPLTREDLVSFFDNGKTSLVSRNLTAKYADGGNLPKMDTAAVEDLVNNNPQQQDKEVVVSVVDIINRMDNIQRVKVLAGLGD